MNFFVGLTFVAGFLFVLGLHRLMAAVRSERERKRRAQVKPETRTRQFDRTRAAAENPELYEMVASKPPDQPEQPLNERIELFFEQAGIRTSPTRFLGLMLLFVAFVAAGVGILSQNWLSALLAAAVGCVLPYTYVSRKRQKRLQKLLSQLPDAFDLISRMMKAGQPFTQAMLVTAGEADAPLSEEFGYACDQQRLGMTADSALRDLARRTGVMEVRIFVLAVLIQRQTGGNLSDLLENLAEIIRERYRVKGIISTLTAEGRVQAYVLLALPILMLLGMTMLNPDYVRELYARPWLLSTTGFCMLLGALWMQRIVNFDY